jgi:teichuronic acid biosynthesis glycosyltransferase TuaC
VPVVDNRRPPGAQARVVVFSSLFPSQAAPTAGLFIRERMFRVARQLPLVVVAPVPWSPLDGLVRLRRPGFRPKGPHFEMMDGIEVHRPRYPSLPGLFKRFDGALMALACRGTFRRIVDRFAPTLVDAHFLYPDGYAASELARRHRLPLTVTIRGSKDEWLIGTDREPMLVQALSRADRIFSVSESLKRDVAVRLGAPAEKVMVIGNGVDLDRFTPVDRATARARLGVAPEERMLLGVGGLVSRKGFQRVIPLLPELRHRFPSLSYWIVGAGTTQENLQPALEALARRHGVEDIVRFCGRRDPSQLAEYYSAADSFVLATEHEGWANVFLEAMACGLPVVTTRVGGNAEVVIEGRCGLLVDYWDPAGFANAIADALDRPWDREAIIAHARAHGWDERIERLTAELRRLGRPGEA